MKSTIIREVLEKDNSALAAVIRRVLVDIGVPKVGTAYADPELDYIHKTYLKEKAVYFVLEGKGIIIGGAGIAPLQGGEPTVCELQKMYFLAAARGKGIRGKNDRSLSGLLLKNKRAFEMCYIETLPYMKAAQKLYHKKRLWIHRWANGHNRAHLM